MMATHISFDNQRIWAPSMHMSGHRSFGKPPSSQDGYVPTRSTISHCQMTSNDVITISSDEESGTDDEDDEVNVTLQSSRPHESRLSVAASDASGEPIESYSGRIDEHPPRLLGTIDDHTLTSPPADIQSPVQTEIISPAPSGPVADDSLETTFGQFVSVPQNSVWSDEMATEPTDSFDVALESDDELCPSHQPGPRGATRSNREDLVENSDNADASTNARQASKISPMLVQSGIKLFDDATVRTPIQGCKLSDASTDDARDLSGRSRQGGHTVQSKTPCLDKAHTDATTMDDTEERSGIPNPCGGSNKRRRCKAREPADRGSDSDDEFIPPRKLRKASSHRHKQNASHYRKSKRVVTDRRARNHAKIIPTSGDQNLDSTIASYEEWLLTDAVLKCIRDNGTMTFQMQFTHTPSSCDIHTIYPQKRSRTSHKDTAQPRSHVVKTKDLSLHNEDSWTLKPGVLAPQASPNDSDDSDIYKAELLARWGKSIFFLKWDIDGSTGWEPRRNILDKKMLHNFESSYVGFDEGVEVLNTRQSKHGKRQCLLHFHGRPRSEDSWVKEDLLSPNLLERARQTGLDVTR